MSAPVLPWQTTATFTLRGIDVSAHQRPEAYDPSPLDFVIARASYGDRPDFTAAAHARRVVERPRPDGTVAAFGLYVFVRHGTAPNSTPAAQIKAARQGIEAAREVWERAPDRALGNVWLDLEENSAFDGQFSAARALEIYETIRADLARDYALGIYTAPGWFRAQFPDPPAEWKAVDYWLAHWGAASGARPSPIVWGDGRRARIAIWQFGLVQLPGAQVDGNVANVFPTQPRTTPPPAPPAPSVPPSPEPAPLLEQLSAELADARANLELAVAALGKLSPTDPARLHVERARKALTRCAVRR